MQSGLAYIGDMKTNYQRGGGRGNNPTSRKNLTGAACDAYLYQRYSNTGWSPIIGPTTYRHASQLAKSGNQKNTDPNIEYAATRGKL